MWYGVAGITSYAYNWENMVFMLNKWLVLMWWQQVHLTVCDMWSGLSISSKAAPWKLAPLRFASCRSQPLRSQFMRSAPASTAPRRSQFCRFAFLRVATRRLIAAMWLPSRLTHFMFAPSRFALLPAGSSKLHPWSEACSRLTHSILTPNRLAVSSFACDRSALSNVQYDRFAPVKFAPLRTAYLKFM